MKMETKSLHHIKRALKYFKNKTNTWSIAHGIRHGTFFMSSNMCGNEEENEGADWTAGKPILPDGHSFLNPKIPLAWLNVTHSWIWRIFSQKSEHCLQMWKIMLIKEYCDSY